MQDTVMVHTCRVFDDPRVQVQAHLYIYTRGTRGYSGPYLISNEQATPHCPLGPHGLTRPVASSQFFRVHYHYFYFRTTRTTSLCIYLFC